MFLSIQNWRQEGCRDSMPSLPLPLHKSTAYNYASGVAFFSKEARSTMFPLWVSQLPHHVTCAAFLHVGFIIFEVPSKISNDHPNEHHVCRARATGGCVAQLCRIGLPSKIKNKQINKNKNLWGISKRGLVNHM